MRQLNIRKRSRIHHLIYAVFCRAAAKNMAIITSAMPSAEIDLRYSKETLIQSGESGCRANLSSDYTHRAREAQKRRNTLCISSFCLCPYGCNAEPAKICQQTPKTD